MQKLGSLILDNNDVNNKLARIAFQIIEEYHNGKIVVKKSEINKGTSFLIQLEKLN